MALDTLRRQHPRQEPSAVVPLAGICAGGRPQGRSLPQTFLFTDIEGSTRLWQPDEPVMGRPGAPRRSSPRWWSRRESSPPGDGLAAVFAGRGAVVAARRATALAAEPWPTATPLRVRMGLHTGEAESETATISGPR